MSARKLVAALVVLTLAGCASLGNTGTDTDRSSLPGAPGEAAPSVNTETPAPGSPARVSVSSTTTIPSTPEEAVCASFNEEDYEHYTPEEVRDLYDLFLLKAEPVVDELQPDALGDGMDALIEGVYGLDDDVAQARSSSEASLFAAFRTSGNRCLTYLSAANGYCRFRAVLYRQAVEDVGGFLTPEALQETEESTDECERKHRAAFSAFADCHSYFSIPASGYSSALLSGYEKCLGHTLTADLGALARSGARSETTPTTGPTAGRVLAATPTTLGVAATATTIPPTAAAAETTATPTTLTAAETATTIPPTAASVPTATATAPTTTIPPVATSVPTTTIPPTTTTTTAAEVVEPPAYPVCAAVTPAFDYYIHVDSPWRGSMRVWDALSDLLEWPWPAPDSVWEIIDDAARKTIDNEIALSDLDGESEILISRYEDVRGGGDAVTVGQMIYDAGRWAFYALMNSPPADRCGNYIYENRRYCVVMDWYYRQAVDGWTPTPGSMERLRGYYEGCVKTLEDGLQKFADCATPTPWTAISECRRP